ncbi:AI-2E family transporter [Antarcticirhabdus aurantiaca]|uniref:AI-2E family transporter n=1 Tax=Antarcticirhabdus aurantiaca TaxID=2606717 RepID=A0ACD4NP39_9HYPH|nr:AI-2E family transporter [Antarcticirhabdus aurantiaca]WAJ28632.1 AI-2E family transporter [Jeongeuplla avenae]
MTHENARLARQTALVTGVAAAILCGIALLVYAGSVFLIVFAGLLFAAIFRGLANALHRLGVPVKLGLVVVVLLFLALLGLSIAYGGVTLVGQFRDLLRGVESQAGQLISNIENQGLPLVGDGGPIEPGQLASLLPNPQGLFTSAGQAVFGALGALGNLFVIFFLAVFVAWQPSLYRDGLVSLFPKDKRERVREVLKKSAHALVMWVAGSGISMLTVFVVSWAGLWLIGMPNAFLLALQAGILAFIPTLGAFVAGVVIVLAALGEGMTMALWALGIYVLIQGVESNITTPIAQRYMTALPPALTLGFQILFGLLFGLLGFVMAVPFLAVLIVLVREFYVEDALGGMASEEAGAR